MTNCRDMSGPVDSKEEPQQDMFRDIGAAVEDVGAGGGGGGGGGGGDGVDENRENNIDEPQVVDNIESLCMNCHEQGVTRLLLTRIPFFREVVLMSFSCPHCHFSNAEIQSAGTIQERGCTYKLKIDSKDDMDRQVVKSETCVCRFEELDLEIPAQRGQLTTAEGLLSNVLDDLDNAQEARKQQQPDAWAKIAEFLQRARDMLEGRNFPFTLTINDPAGNSWIEPKPGDARDKWSRSDYERTPAQNEALALTDTTVDKQEEEEDKPKESDYEIRPDEVHTFPASCPSCVRPCSTHMKLVEIPHFQEVIIMSTACESCGYKSNEVKTGGAVPSQGRIITLQVEDEEDLARDILKSETCALSCPELNLDLHPGTLGGRFTTLEGLLSQVHDDLQQRVFTETSDSLDAATKAKWETFFLGLQEAKDGKRKFTCILDDPLAASYVQNLCAPDPDPQLKIVNVDRTAEQDEDLGITDMNTEDYAETEKEKEKEKEEKVEETPVVEADDEKKKKNDEKR